MSDSSDGDPRVRPVESSKGPSKESRPAASTLIAVFLAAAVVATALFIGFDSDSDTREASPTSLDSTTGTTAPNDFVTSTSAGPDTSAVDPAGGTDLGELLADSLGSALTVVSGQELVHWTATAPRSTSTIPILNGPVLDFDESGQHMAFLGPSATAAGPVLYVGTWDSWAVAGVGVSSFRWHEGDWGRLSWLESGDPSLLCSAEVDIEEVLGPSTCIEGTGDEIVGFDSAGFLVADHADRMIIRLDTSGRLVQAITGTDAVLGPDGHVLVMERSLDGAETTFSMASGDLTEVTALDWAPQNAAAEYGSFAWSPIIRDGPRIAFLVYGDNGGWQVQLWDSGGTSYGTVELSGRVWDVSWDSTGRYLLVPGILDESEHTLQVYDTFPGSLQRLSFGDWVQDASLVTESVCVNASQAARAFETRLQDGVSLGSSRMVLSRDAGLESWYFVSAIVDGGRFDGAVASWALPGFDERKVDTSNTPALSIPINEAAVSLGFGMTGERPTDHGVDDWFQLDGAMSSQECLQNIG